MIEQARFADSIAEGLFVAHADRRADSPAEAAAFGESLLELDLLHSEPKPAPACFLVPLPSHSLCLVYYLSFCTKTWFSHHSEEIHFKQQHQAGQVAKQLNRRLKHGVRLLHLQQAATEANLQCVESSSLQDHFALQTSRRKGLFYRQMQRPHLNSSLAQTICCYSGTTFTHAAQKEFAQQDSEVNTKIGGRTHIHGDVEHSLLDCATCSDIAKEYANLFQQAFSVSHFLIKSEPLEGGAIFSRESALYTSIATEVTPVFAA